MPPASTTLGSMNNLTPVQRQDRNGKIVTRHMKLHGDATAATSNVPAPKLSVVSDSGSLTDGLRLVPSQQTPRKRTESGSLALYAEPVSFEASDVEVYEVLSVTTPSTGLNLLINGARSAQDAAEQLSAEGREDELVDNAAMAREMLSRRVSAFFYIMGMERLSEEQLNEATPELLADYLDFFATRSIIRKDSHQVADEVLRGEIRLSDVREVGINNLKIQNKLEISRPAFKELKKGNPNFTAQDLSNLLQSRIYGRDLTTAIHYMTQYGSSHLLHRLGATNDAFGNMTLDEMATSLYYEESAFRDEAFAVIDYTARLVDAADLKVDTRSKDKVIEVLHKGKILHDAVVDVQYAAERIHDEDPQVIAAVYHGTPKSVSSGWL